MHELSIAQTVCEVAIDQLKDHPDCSVHRIGLRIGRLSDVVPEALEFGFDVIKQDTVLAHATLSIETIPVTGRCRACAESFTIDNFRFICPMCESSQVDVLGGQELEISFMELDDKPEGHFEHPKSEITANGQS
jgi:hydrogenase nickel incorporation protein HypA/HybF